MVRVGIYTFELYLSSSSSLKDKRKILKSLKDRLRSKHNVSIAEVDGQELWQRSTLAVVSVSNSEASLQASFHKIHNEIDKLLPGEVVAEQMEFL